MVAFGSQPLFPVRPSGDAIIAFRRRLAEMDDRAYLASLAAYHAAPTLAGIKPASLFRPAVAGRNLTPALPGCAGELRLFFGVEMERLDRGEDGVAPLLLLYEPSLLDRTLRRREASALLAAAGYGVSGGGVADRLAFLRARCSSARLPHEIGVFLGYPPGDVHRFMSGAPAANAVNSPGWLAFADQENACRTGEAHRWAKRLTAARMAEGADWREASLAVRLQARSSGLTWLDN